jgi:hypothetical protein
VRLSSQLLLHNYAPGKCPIFRKPVSRPRGFSVAATRERILVEERERRALAIIGRLKELAAPVIENEPIVYRRAPSKEDDEPACG